MSIVNEITYCEEKEKNPQEKQHNRRDLFAAAALTGLLAGKWYQDGDELIILKQKYAINAFRMAEQMLTESEKKV